MVPRCRCCDVYLHAFDCAYDLHLWYFTLRFAIVTVLRCVLRAMNRVVTRFTTICCSYYVDRCYVVYRDSDVYVDRRADRFCHVAVRCTFPLRRSRVACVVTHALLPLPRFARIAALHLRFTPRCRFTLVRAPRLSIRCVTMFPRRLRHTHIGVRLLPAFAGTARLLRAVALHVARCRCSR